MHARLLNLPATRYKTTFKYAAYYLTTNAFSMTLTFMDESFASSLTSLERKVITVLDLCQSLRTENQALRDRVAVLEGVNLTLNEKIETTCSRLEELMTKLPEA